jgi:hypothetical protein
MKCLLALTVGALVLGSGSVFAGGLSGQYIEARTCDIWTAPCFANAEVNLVGKNAVMAWKIDKGTVNNIDVKGLGVVAVVEATDTLGQQQTGPAKAVLIVDSKASKAQREALIDLAKQQGGDLLQNILDVQTASIDLTDCQCKGGSCAKLSVGKVANIETRCVDSQHDKICGNESAFYPPLAKNTKAKAAVAVEHTFAGKGFQQTWKEVERRSAYFGPFEVP